MLRFAVAGAPLSTPKPGGTIEGIKRARKIGIAAMEIEWVQNVPTKDPNRMVEIRRLSEDLDVTLTVHAPYYVNLNSPDTVTLAASKKRILDALTMGEIAGVSSVCVHAAFNMGQPPPKVYDNVRRAMDDILKHKKLFHHVNLGLETMGKPTQFGTLEEVLKISREFDQYPVIDPAHLHARYNGAMNSTEEWHDMFDLYEKYLGKKSLKTMHMHYSGIAYGPKGEKHHLPLKESDARWKEFLQVLKDRGIGGTLVCESPLLEEDTLLLQRTFTKL